MKSGPEISRLRELLSYDNQTGFFTWLVAKRSPCGSGAVNTGDRAGSFGNKGYVYIGIDGVRYSAHRLAWLYMYDVWPAVEIDHRDRNPSNNAIDNLRLATRKQNNANIGASKNNKSGVKGVCFEKRRRKWRAVISVDGKQRHLGLFAKIDDARAAYVRAESEIYGQFCHAFSAPAPIQHTHSSDPPVR